MENKYRHFGQLSKFFSKYFACISFYLLHNVRRTKRWQTIQKYMSVVLIAFYCNDLYVQLLTFDIDQFFESFLNIGYIKYLSPISGTKYKMIIYQRNRCIRMPIFIFHMYVISYYVYVVKQYIQHVLLFIPPLKGVGFHFFCKKNVLAFF